LVAAQPEKVALLLESLDLPTAVDVATVGDGSLRDKGLTARAIPSLVDALIDVAPLDEALEEPLNGPSVNRVGRADEAGVLNPQTLPEAVVVLDDPVGQLLGGDAPLRAARSAFWPCSSVPVRKKTSYPRSRL